MYVGGRNILFLLAYFSFVKHLDFLYKIGNKWLNNKESKKLNCGIIVPFCNNFKYLPIFFVIPLTIPPFNNILITF